MDNKLSELSKPVAWKLHHHDRYYFEENADVVAIAESMGQAKGDAVYSQEFVSALDKVAQFWIGESAGWKKRAEDAEKRIAELEGQLQSGFTPEALAQEERAENAEQRVAELEAKTAMTMGVGSGNGNLFVHGDYDSIKAAQAIVLENESLRAKLATPVRLPKRWDISGQVNPPRIVEVQFEQQNRTHDQCAEAIRAAGFTVKSDI
ncbi:hypothetical protein ACJ8JY_03535 [Serratia sp. CY54039]|uniref:hypothetical protein n=1 Tax=unclassified Serratia (in: enterobacteria) TaxID=2647522 RepID=UPI003FA17A31